MPQRLSRGFVVVVSKKAISVLFIVISVSILLTLVVGLFMLFLRTENSNKYVDVTSVDEFYVEVFDEPDITSVEELEEYIENMPEGIFNGVTIKNNSAGIHLTVGNGMEKLTVNLDETRETDTKTKNLVLLRPSETSNGDIIGINPGASGAVSLLKTENYEYDISFNTPRLVDGFFIDEGSFVGLTHENGIVLYQNNNPYTDGFIGPTGGRNDIINYFKVGENWLTQTGQEILIFDSVYSSTPKEKQKISSSAVVQVDHLHYLISEDSNYTVFDEDGVEVGDFSISIEDEEYRPLFGVVSSVLELPNGSLFYSTPSSSSLIPVGSSVDTNITTPGDVKDWIKHKNKIIIIADNNLWEYNEQKNIWRTIGDLNGQTIVNSLLSTKNGIYFSHQEGVEGGYPKNPSILFVEM